LKHSEFFIDLAVVDSRQPGRYLLGIECDGATYHSARSARDRDRLRQKVLEDKGWTIYRIWSTDWFRNPQKELDRLIASIEKAKTISGLNIEMTKDQNAKSSNTIDRYEKQLIDTEKPLNVQEYKIANFTGISSDVLYNPQSLSSLIKRIVSVESPVHSQEALRRVLFATDTKRAGSSIQDNFQKAIRYASNIGYIDVKGNFLWQKGMKLPTLRNRKEMPSNSKKIEYIAEEEILLAIKSVISTNFGMEKDCIPTACCHLLGFSRATDEMQVMFFRLIDKLLLKGTLASNGTSLIIDE